MDAHYLISGQVARGDGLERPASVPAAAQGEAETLIADIRALLADSLGVGVTCIARVVGGSWQVEQFHDRVGMALRPGAPVPWQEVYSAALGADGSSSLIVEDVRADARFASLAAPERSIGAMTAIPLHQAGGQLYGALCTLHPSARTVPGGETGLLRLAGRMIMQAREAAALRKEQAEEAAALAEVSAALVTTLEPAALYPLILQQAARVLPCDLANVVLLEEDGWLTIVASWGETTPALGARIGKQDGTVPLWRPDTEGPAYLADTDQEPNWRHVPPHVGANRIRSIIAVPLVVDGARVGAFDVCSTRPHAYSARHLRIAGAFAERVQQALRNARLYAAEQERARVAEELARVRQEQAEEAEAMAALTAAMAGALEPAALYQVILQQAARVLPFDHAEIMLYQDGWEVIAACLGEPTAHPGTRLVAVDTADPIYQALARGQTQHLDDTAEVPTWRDCPPWVGPYRVRSGIIVPLLVDGALLGVFEVFSYTPRFYNPEHVRLASRFGERATQAVRNARLYAAEQQRARAAEELARLRSDFVAAVSHELRTPLTAIVGFAELLQAHWGEFSEARRLERLAQIVLAANRQKRLVEDLLLLNRLEGAGLAPQCARLPLRALVEQAAAEVQGSYAGQRVLLEGPAELRVRADPAHSLQVLANLLDNAAKYSPEGSPIAVRWAREGGMVAVRVVDRGSGVPAEGRERLFARFGRLPGSRIRAGRAGTGLGLYISRGLAEAMGGELDLEATGPQGSTFRLRLPAVLDAEHPPAPEPE